ncbi:MAG: DNA-directed DNA polymerase I [Candidatus Hodarchaeota archaeon]
MSYTLNLDQFINNKKDTDKKEEKPILPDQPEPKSEMERADFDDQRVTPTNTDPCLLLSVSYDGKRGLAFARLYDLENKNLFFWYDNTNHKPYCISDLGEEELRSMPKIINHKGFSGFETAEKFDLLRDKNIKVTKIIANDPLSIGGSSGSIRDVLMGEKLKVWEAYIRYHHSYIMDRGLVPGLLYQIRDGQLVQSDVKLAEVAQNEILDIFSDEKEEFRELASEYSPIFLQPAPDICRVAVDIEVYAPVPDRIPNPVEAEYPVLATSIVSNDGAKRVLVLRFQDMVEGDPPESFPKDANVEFFDDEKKLVLEVFKVLSEYPLVLTFNGDNFDFNYLWHRAQRLGFAREEIPIILGRDSASLRYGVHIDLYRFFHNRSIQIYAFSRKYQDSRLNTITQALLNVGKIELQKPIPQLTLYELAHYCLNDAQITLDLTLFNNNLTLRLILLLMRVSHLPIEDVVRQAVSGWIKNLFYFEHRKRGYLIPRPEDIIEEKGETSTKAIIKGKKYKGAVVIPPVKGIHFNVTVLDFASLYPSIIKQFNLSYETIRCPHPGDRKNKIPETDHWVCTKRLGLTSLVIGLLRDVRINWLKPKSKDKGISSEVRNWYSVVQQALKVFLNASYGVFGAEIFPLYCPPVAESTAAVGRFSIMKTIEAAQNLNVPVIYGDTDSVFLLSPDREQIAQLTRWSSKELGIELDVDKVYRYIALSERKKNYLGVFEDGSVDVKGLTGKKRNTPVFLQNAFLEMIDALSKVESPQEFSELREKIHNIARESYQKLENREYSLEDLAFRVQLGKSVEGYTKTTPQHVKAAKQLVERKKEVKAGDIITFVKTKKEPGVRPIEIASIKDVDVEKYKGYIRTTFEQVLDALGIEFQEIVGTRKLSEFF